MVKKKIMIGSIIVVVVSMIVIILSQLFHIGKLARCSIINPTAEQISVIEEELGINLSDDCIVTKLLFTLDHSLWGFGNNTLCITIQPTDVDAFLSQNIPFALNDSLYGMNQYGKKVSFSISDDTKTILVSEEMTRNFLACRNLFFQKQVLIEWL